jgi:hypothetical protein
MNVQKYNAHTILICDYFVFVIGLVGTVADFINRAAFNYPLNLGIVLGNGAVVIIFLFALMISKCLLKIESRLDLIESKTGSWQQTTRGTAE